MYGRPHCLLNGDGERASTRKADFWHISGIIIFFILTKNRYKYQVDASLSRLKHYINCQYSCGGDGDRKP
jgi:hypothetical protein